MLFLFVVCDSDGAGGKGTWGKLLDTDPDLHIDPKDPNYDSDEVWTIHNHIYLRVYVHKYYSCDM